MELSEEFPPPWIGTGPPWEERGLGGRGDDSR